MKLVWQPLFLVLTFTGSMLAEQSLTRKLAEVASIANQSVPMLMAPGIEMVNVMAVGPYLTYNIRFVNVMPADATKAEIQQAIDTQIKPDGTRSVCSGPNSRILIREGATFRYAYLYADGTHAGNYEITEEDCRRLPGR